MGHLLPRDPSQNTGSSETERNPGSPGTCKSFPVAQERAGEASAGALNWLDRNEVKRP